MASAASCWQQACSAASGVCTPQKPVILPVNYSVVGESIIFRTSPYGVVANHDWASPIAFEVDYVDYADHKGWSVLATGRGDRVEDPEETRRGSSAPGTPLRGQEAPGRST